MEEPINYLAFTIHYFPFSIHYLLFNFYFSLFAFYFSLFAIRYSLTIWSNMNNMNFVLKLVGQTKRRQNLNHKQTKYTTVRFNMALKLGYAKASIQA